jgi:hypothetical protein
LKSLPKLFPALVLIAVSMGTGVALHAAFGPEPEPVAQADSPTLASKQLVGLVYGHIMANTSEGNSVLAQSCLYRETEEPSAAADYQGNGQWVVTTPGGCTFVVNDQTGKVTGP